jgi:nucleotide-binding universal stress UspA family protein
MVLFSEGDSMYDLILVPIDGSPTAQRGLDEALALAGRLGSRLHLLNVVDARLLIAEASMAVPPGDVLDAWRLEGERLVRAAEAAASARGVKADSAVRCEPGMRVCDVIVQEVAACGAGLIVMGTHGRQGLRRLTLGSDAELVLRDSPVPVLLVRDPANASR